MSNQMTEEDTNTLHSMCGAIRADQFCAIEHINTLTDLIRKYGCKQLDACIDQLNAEKRGATK